MLKANIRRSLFLAFPVGVVLFILTWVDTVRYDGANALWLLLGAAILFAVVLAMYLIEPRAPWVRRPPHHPGPLTLVWRRR